MLPYQHLTRSGNVLFAASGSRIDSFSLENGSFLSTWSCPLIQNLDQLVHDSPGPDPVGSSSPRHTTQTSEPPSTDVGNVALPRPVKRQKLSVVSEEDQDSHSKEGTGKPKKQNNRSDAVSSGLLAPAVIALTATSTGKHVVAVTGEDKSIRVFEHDLAVSGNHSLKQISVRPMPKRPCSICITSDGTTIISADKFGDVYSLPLIVNESPTSTFTRSQSPPKASKPSANEFTIHSQRNRKALENQKRQTRKASEKSGKSFEHTLLLGHVSMLIDVALVCIAGKHFVLTADRDEHIRVSRGIPQSHVIEGYCLGHTEFITKLCVPHGREDILISGGGDNDLYIWQWQAGNLVMTFNMKDSVVQVMHEVGNGGVEDVKIVVSSLIHTRLAKGDEAQDLIIVTYEGIPAMFILELTSFNTLSLLQLVKLQGNALDVLCYRGGVGVSTTHQIIVSIDTFHKPGSMVERRNLDQTFINPLPTFNVHEGTISPANNSTFFEIRKNLAIGAEEGAGRLTNLLYNLGPLRKQEDEVVVKED